MTESIKEIVARIDKDPGYMISEDELLALIASWRERGEALKPFAKIALIYDTEHYVNEWANKTVPWHDDDRASPRIFVGDLRRARAALNGSSRCNKEAKP